MQICPSCAEENPPKFRLCGYCGAPLAAEPPPQEVRKRVTILFCDLKGSTTLGESLDTELFARLFAMYDDHRCVVANYTVDELRERAEQESLKMAERAGEIKQLELAEPPHGSISLYERAERESVLLAEWALRFRAH